MKSSFMGQSILSRLHHFWHFFLHMKQWASMHELDIHDGALVWLTAPSNQIAEETLYLPSILTISGSTVLGDYESIQPLGFDANNYQR